MIYFRMIFGDALIILTVLFTAYLCRVMLKRIHAVVLTGAYKKIFLAELLVCMILLVCALDIRFSLLTGSSAAGLKVFGWIIRILLYAFAVLILTLTAVIIIGGRKRDEGSGSHIIVLGMALENGKPNKDLLLRVEAASAFAEAHPETSLILTGGNADVSGLTEASVMEELFLQKGLEASRLFLEDRSADTVENFRNVSALIDPGKPVILVTNSYHMMRAVSLAKEAGFKEVQRLPAGVDRVRFLSNVFWEVILMIYRIVSRSAKTGQYSPTR